MTIPGIRSPAIPYGSTIVVSGATGFVGSHVIDQALAAGFRVRGTTRDGKKGAWAEEYFKSKYGSDEFDLVEVPVMGAENAFDEAVKGASGFIHVAHPTFDLTDPNVDPNAAMKDTVDGALNAIKASANAGIKRFVYASSSWAANAVNMFDSTPNPPNIITYCAAKVRAERALVAWAKENAPDMVVNMLCPDTTMGPIINPEHQGYPTSAFVVPALFNSNYEPLKGFPPQHFIHVQDNARLHLIALVNPDVRSERVFGMVAPWSLNGIIDILRKLYPTKTWENFPEGGEDISIVEPIPRAEKLLKEAYGTGFLNLEESVKGNAAGLA